MDWLMAVDNGILDAIQQGLRCAPLDWLMAFFSQLGEAGMVWIVVTLVLLARKKTRRWGVILGITLLAGLLLGELGLKNVVQRLRPCQVPGMDVVMAVPPPDSFSFPSGHTMSSFEAATVLWRMDRRWGGPALVLAVLIAFSRMYLYVHYPSDVLAGAVFGVGLASLIIWLFERKEKTKEI
ncbi:MAG: phosphatase PAP2 family protein [Eubacteriales bacterium]|jgi:undecaprenyl-diphosphatase